MEHTPPGERCSLAKTTITASAEPTEKAGSSGNGTKNQVLAENYPPCLKSLPLPELSVVGEPHFIAIEMHYALNIFCNINMLLLPLWFEFICSFETAQWKLLQLVGKLLWKVTNVRGTLLNLEGDYDNSSVLIKIAVKYDVFIFKYVYIFTSFIEGEFIYQTNVGIWRKQSTNQLCNNLINYKYLHIFNLATCTTS